ncbi:GntR family transcriptional regulator [Limimaricola litoreus]|uniref:GntR family transcriptional regulator n=1 Tax=Limimaricola litoreus TaxID=2955316 RepID=A0A9X2FTZ0_9RHOB|nr:GntR family transcriptional regulator [Limimaricola litoreus]MCP1170660.1 GntR family transcriptional regulator [Limimaricola litoreus]
MPDAPSDSHGAPSLRRRAYEQVTALLDEGRLRPGEIVSQRRLMEITGATLGAIREAVPRLEADGLLVTVPKKGLMVPSLDVSYVRNAYQVRRMIELSALPDMLTRIDAAEVSDWLDWHRSLVEEIEASGGIASTEQLGRLQARDWDMHSRFVSSMDNVLIDEIYRVTMIKIRMAVQSRLRVTGNNALRVIREHLAILEPLARRDAEATAVALERHIAISLALALGASP